MKPLEIFRNEFLIEADMLIKQNVERVNLYVQQGRKIIQDERLPKFADIDKETKLATLNTMKLDQQINEAAKNEIYNHIDFIQKDWEDAFFTVIREDVDFKVENSTAIKRKSASAQLKEDYHTLKNHQSEQQESKIFNISQSVEQCIKNTNPLAYQAYKLLDETTILELKYNVKKVQAAVIVKENNLVEIKLLKLLNNAFRVNNFYSNEQIKSKLQQIYNDLNIREENGKIKVALANQIAESGRFETKETKRKNNKGKEEHGRVILRPQFALRMAA